jgi:hypothetical protein
LGGTEADKLRAHYKAVGDAQNHKFGEGLPGSKPPDFNLSLKPGQGPANQGPAAPKPTSTTASSPAPEPRPSAPSSAPRPRPPAPGVQPPASTSSPAAAPEQPVSERPHNE